VTPEEIIRDHIPSLTDEDEEEILNLATNVIGTDELDVADLAIRTCHCGKRIDGFYEYADHLIEVMSKGLPWT
jgi:hypothetical protein